MKKEFNFNVQLLGLNQKPLKENDEPMILAKGLALNLAQTTSGDALKFYSWGVDLEKEGKLTLDPSDVDLLKKTINGFSIASLIKAQYLLILNK